MAPFIENMEEVSEEVKQVFKMINADMIIGNKNNLVSLFGSIENVDTDRNQLLLKTFDGKIENTFLRLLGKTINVVNYMEGVITGKVEIRGYVSPESKIQFLAFNKLSDTFGKF